jgi:hypothetical protein
MHAEITRYALDRTPLSLIIDDSTLLVNLNYFFMRDRNLVDGQKRRWEDVPVVHPEAFTREFAQFCLDQGVRGKFSVVPCPAAIGRIDQGLPLFSRAQQESWLQMCRELILPAFDITPEMITHTVVVDLDKFQPLPSGIWEQYNWEALPEDAELITRYITAACQILVNVGLTPQGVTSPGGFGYKTLEFYARCAAEALRAVTGNPTPYFFTRVWMDRPIETPVWFADRARGEAMGEIIASTGDWTGSWTGYGEVNADKYITADLTGGRLPELIEKGEPAVLISHWQGFYGLHNADRAGFRALQTVVQRLKELDPLGERARWRKPSELTGYAIMREVADVNAGGQSVTLDLPARVPELTLRLDLPARGVRVDGAPLQRAASRAAWRSGGYYLDGEQTLLAFNPAQRQVKIEIEQ